MSNTFGYYRLLVTIIVVVDDVVDYLPGSQKWCRSLSIIIDYWQTLFDSDTMEIIIPIKFIISQ